MSQNSAPSPLNKTQLQKLLTIEDPEKETIYGVIGAYGSITRLFPKRRYLPQPYSIFKNLLLCNKSIMRKNILNTNNFFWSIRDHEILDVYFASLYLSRFLSFLENGEIVRPWEHYFTYCTNPHGIPFLQMLLGINAHINTDYMHLLFI